MVKKNTNKQIKAFNPDDFNLRVYWTIINKNRWSIIALTLVLTIFSFVIAYSITPVYQSGTTIMLETRQANVVSIEQVYEMSSRSRRRIEHFNTQIELMKSRQILSKVVDKLNLLAHPEFKRKSSGFSSFIKGLTPDFIRDFSLASSAESIRKKKVKSLTEEQKREIRKNILVYRILKDLDIILHKDSDLIGIWYSSPDPDLAAQIADAVAQSYVEYGYEAELQMTQGAVSWITERLGKIKKELEESEQKLDAYQEKEKLLNVRGVQTVSADELKNLSSKLLEAKRERSKIETIYRQIRKIKKPSLQAYELIPGVYELTVVQQAKLEVSRASQEVVKLSEKYGRKHPKMIAAKREVDKSNKNYLRLLVNIAKGFEEKYNNALRHESGIKSDLEQSKDEIRNINKKSYKLLALEREVETNRQLYETFFKRFKETNETTGLHSAEARIVDKAIVPRKPVKPRKKLIILTAFIFSLGLGVLLVLIREALSTTIRTPEDVQEHLTAPLLGALPLLDVDESDEQTMRLQFIENNKSKFSEAIRTIRTGVMLSGLDGDLKVAVITSSVPNEGKTTVSLNLAMALGAMEKVLLIDADLRRPSIAKACQMKSGPGLSALVAGTASIEECITSFPDWSIDILPAGVVPPNPQELLGSKKFDKLITELGQSYDRIIIDTAPTQAVSDALLIAKYANEVIYVVKADATSRNMVNAGLDSLNQNGANISGVILNHLDFIKSQKYSSDYYTSYYGNYDYS